MNPSDEQRIHELLKSALPPVGRTEIQRDLWPQMLERIEADEAERVAFGPLDWIIAAAVAASILIFPGLIPILLYHL